MYQAVIGPQTFVVKSGTVPPKYRLVAPPFAPLLPTPVSVVSGLRGLLPGPAMKKQAFVVGPSFIPPGVLMPPVIGVPTMPSPVPPMALRTPLPIARMPPVFPGIAPKVMPPVVVPPVLPGSVRVSPPLGLFPPVVPPVAPLVPPLTPAVVTPSTAGPITSYPKSLTEKNDNDPMEFLNTASPFWGKVSYQSVVVIPTGSPLAALSDDEIKSAFNNTIKVLVENWWAHGKLDTNRFATEIQVTAAPAGSTGTKQVTIKYTSFIYRLCLGELVVKAHKLSVEATEDANAAYTKMSNPSDSDKLNRNEFTKDTIQKFQPIIFPFGPFGATTLPKATMMANINSYYNKNDYPDEKKFRDLVAVWVSNNNTKGVDASNNTPRIFGGSMDQQAKQETNILEAMFAQNIAQQVYAEIIKTTNSGNLPEMVPRLEKLVPMYNSAFYLAKHKSEQLE